ncbi:MAG: SAM-dependent methyltransferase [Variovorax paradoxus]|nr:MAG: SAM-dependent methyltransferase [Variovorax paradoxus]PZQ05938.1 MAG: SAM-dependent methyltransferase [Variovorax paradoxus]
MRGYFDGLYAGASDPYGTRERWYERRKRALLLASLPRERFRRCYEPGCGSAELTRELAMRCDSVLATDFSAQALRTARARTAGLAQVQLAQHRLPRDWPCGERFDLVVLSEIGYFLSAAAMQEVAQHCAASLDADGVLVACDWRAPFAQRACPTQEVHALLGATGLAPLVVHTEDDFCLRVWARDARSVAQREGIR